MADAVRPIPSERSLWRASQAWATPATESIVMDTRLAVAFARILDDELSALEHEYADRYSETTVLEALDD